MLGIKSRLVTYIAKSLSSVLLLWSKNRFLKERFLKKGFQFDFGVRFFSFGFLTTTNRCLFERHKQQEHGLKPYEAKVNDQGESMSENFHYFFPNTLWPSRVGWKLISILNRLLLPSWYYRAAQSRNLAGEPTHKYDRLGYQRYREKKTKMTENSK